MKSGAPLRRKTPLRSRPSTKKGSRSGKTKKCGREGCTKTFYAFPSRLSQKFCSRSCAYVSRPPQPPEANRVRREKNLDRRGPKNPNYRHGKKTGKHDRELARAFNLRKKAENRCRVCGSTENVQPHHAIPRSLGTKESRLNLLNLLPLCASCHVRWHRRSLTISREVFRAEEWEYLTSVRLTGRNTLAWLDDRYPARAAA